MPRIIVDCTHTFGTGAFTGIQRVVRRFADALLELAPASGAHVVPVRVANGEFIPLPIENGRVAFPTASLAREAEPSAHNPAWQRLLAMRRWGHRANTLLRSARIGDWLEAGPNEDGLVRTLASRGARARDRNALRLGPTDIVLLLDSSWVYDVRTPLDAARGEGAAAVAMLCDVLPLSHPEYFTHGTRRYFRGWLEVLLPRIDGLVAISAATCRELRDVAAAGALRAAAPPPCEVVHLGAELEAGASGTVREQLRSLLTRAGPPAFLMVGTLEPRKNVEYAIEIFDELLACGVECQWHIVGSPGWLAETTIQKIRNHPQHNRALHWWSDLRDGELQWCYNNASALVAVSRAEGFGLPLVEARLHGLPVFASDIAVFREVLGREGRYLPLDSPKLAAAVLEDFALRPRGNGGGISSVARPWAEAGAELLRTVLGIYRTRRAQRRTSSMAER